MPLPGGSLGWRMLSGSVGQGILLPERTVAGLERVSTRTDVLGGLLPLLSPPFTRQSKISATRAPGQPLSRAPTTRQPLQCVTAPLPSDIPEGPLSCTRSPSGGKLGLERNGSLVSLASLSCHGH
jgi:hypothetical protein